MRGQAAQAGAVRRTLRCPTCLASCAARCGALLEHGGPCGRRSCAWRRTQRYCTHDAMVLLRYCPCHCNGTDMVPLRYCRNTSACAMLRWPSSARWGWSAAAPTCRQAASRALRAARCAPSGGGEGGILCRWAWLGVAGCGWVRCTAGGGGAWAKERCALGGPGDSAGSAASWSLLCAWKGNSAHGQGAALARRAPLRPAPPNAALRCAALCSCRWRSTPLTARW